MLILILKNRREEKNMASGKELTMSFDPNTIQHLGIKMYSTLPAALAELIANAYDADAINVSIQIQDKKTDKYILVEDDGCGMSLDEINGCFLRIGRNRRSDESMRKTSSGRIATGKKGLGKLALFGIGETIVVSTHKKGEEQKLTFTLDWNDILKCSSTDYHPALDIEIVPATDRSYTSIKITKLKRKSDFSQKELAVALAKMFNFLDTSFQVELRCNEKTPIAIDNKLKYEGITQQFSWEFPTDFTEFLAYSAYSNKNDIHGKIVTTEKPLPTNLRGISLFAHGRLVNLPEFFGEPTSSHFFSYATGWLDIDFIDTDNIIGDDDLISTNRQSLDWERPETISLREFLKDLLACVQKDWRNKRRDANQMTSKSKSNINRDKWLGTLPQDKADTIKQAISNMADPENTDDRVELLENALHAIAPEYAALHWRYLNGLITESKVVERLYAQENYFQAAAEAVKTYISMVKHLSGITGKTDQPLMMEAFGRKGTENKSHPISLTNREDDIEEDIEEGHKFYSAGLVTGFKNPVISHGTEDEVVKRGLFCEKDCLDILSLLSHLFDRLDKRIAPPKSKPGDDATGAKG